MKKIKLTRESVAMGDDIDAPHLLEIEIQSDWTILDILKHILKLNYLFENYKHTSIASSGGKVIINAKFS